MLDERNATTGAPEAAMTLYKAFASRTPYAEGRRTFMKYRDLGLKAASGGRMRAVVSASVPGQVMETGWHYHPVDFQFLYFLKGELTIEFEDGTVCTFAEGDAALIPGGVRHNVIHASDDKEVVELTLPGEIETVRCERPEGLPEMLRPMRSADLPPL